jgi:hypothetical protein
MIVSANESGSMRKQPLPLRIAVVANALLLSIAFIGCPGRNHQPDIIPPTIAPATNHFMGPTIATAPPDFQVMPAPIACVPTEFQPPRITPPETLIQRAPSGPQTVPPDGSSR